MDRVATGVVATLVVGVVLGFVYALQPSAPTVASATIAPAREVPAADRVELAIDVPRDARKAPVPKAPIGRLSTDPDLFATYRELKRSDTGGDLHVARTILLACLLATRSGTAAREVAAGRSPTARGSDLPKPVQIDAAVELLARCHGFEGITNLEVQQALADMNGRLARAEDPVGLGESIVRQRRVLSDDQMRSMLASHDPTAIAFISGGLADRWRRLTNQPIATDEDAAHAAEWQTDVSFLLASCDLGKDCSRESLEMRQYCIYQAAYCDMDLASWFMNDMPAEGRLEAIQRAALFLRAIQDDDFAFWGL